MKKDFWYEFQRLNQKWKFEKSIVSIRKLWKWTTLTWNMRCTFFQARLIVIIDVHNYYANTEHFYNSSLLMWLNHK